MTDHFNYTASQLSDQELKDRIENRPQYLPETIKASVTELQNRGIVFSEEELHVINQDIQAQRDNISKGNSGLSLFDNGYKNNIVEDPAAPYFYSKRAIYIFTVLFSVVFGSIMLAINLWRIKNKTGTILTILFGAAFFSIQIYLTQFANSNSKSAPAYLFGLIAALAINVILWPKFIGNATFYRARPIWVPLIIGVLVSALIIWAIVAGGQQ